MQNNHNDLFKHSSSQLVTFFKFRDENTELILGEILRFRDNLGFFPALTVGLRLLGYDKLDFVAQKLNERFFFIFSKSLVRGLYFEMQ